MFIRVNGLDASVLCTFDLTEVKDLSHRGHGIVPHRFQGIGAARIERGTS